MGCGGRCCTCLYGEERHQAVVSLQAAPTKSLLSCSWHDAPAGAAGDGDMAGLALRCFVNRLTVLLANMR